MERETSTYLIVGLGNPGLTYRHTRHNFGFMALESFADHLSIPLKRIKFKAMIGEGKLNGNPIVLAKPLTYMNESGIAVASLARFFKVPLGNLLVIHDDLDLPLGTLRLRPSGGTAGQRGMESITERLGTEEFPRMRLGINRPPGQMDPKDYVLQKFSKAEQPLRDIVLKQSNDAIQAFILEGLSAAMNKYNGEVA